MVCMCACECACECECVSMGVCLRESSYLSFLHAALDKMTTTVNCSEWLPVSFSGNQLTMEKFVAMGDHPCLAAVFGPH